MRSSVAVLAASASEVAPEVAVLAAVFWALDSGTLPKRDTITSLSVSANNSLRFCIKDSHKWFLEILSTDVRELLFAPLPLVLVVDVEPFEPVLALWPVLEISAAAPIK